ncbi:MAG: hypothetical protein NWF05_03635 [Candidatus Bathyarchaeota archaeon]|nr:hypothetical protein [Candidatus Bathyarchaeota archaeon]
MSKLLVSRIKSINVTDSGDRMPEEAKAQIFTSLLTTKSKDQGALARL